MIYFVGSPEQQQQDISHLYLMQNHPQFSPHLCDFTPLPAHLVWLLSKTSEQNQNLTEVEITEHPISSSCPYFFLFFYPELLWSSCFQQLSGELKHSGIFFRIQIKSRHKAFSILLLLLSSTPPFSFVRWPSLTKVTSTFTLIWNVTDCPGFVWCCHPGLSGALSICSTGTSSHVEEGSSDVPSVLLFLTISFWVSNIRLSNPEYLHPSVTP